MKNKTINISIRLSPDTRAQWRAEAKLRNMSLTQLIEAGVSRLIYSVNTTNQRSKQ